jgi:phospholipid/cholesterol/gamma-HCH transport system substrate-binding protein
MYKVSTELIVGVFVLAGAACLAYLSFSLGDADLFRSPYYSVVAEFESITGLRKGASVEIAGVEVGKVLDISLDQYQANVTLGIRSGLEVSTDTVASIRSKGIIGDKFVKLSPGGSGEMVKPGGRLIETESSINLEELISKYIFETR